MARPDYLFLIGVGRSGTTVLRLSLGLHPCIYYPGTENNIVTDVLRAAYDNCTRPDRANAMLVPRDRYNQIFKQALDALLWQDSVRSATQIRSASFAMANELPAYLLEVFPNARILHLVRNGIEVIASRQLHHAFQAMPFDEHCTRWARAFSMYQWGKEQANTYRLFRYEWLSDETILRAKLTEIFEWLEIPWNEAPLENIRRELYHPTHHPDEPAAAQVDSPRSIDGRNAMAETRSRRWQYWSEAERAQFQELCGTAMQGFGYPIPWQSDSPPRAL